MNKRKSQNVTARSTSKYNAQQRNKRHDVLTPQLTTTGPIRASLFNFIPQKVKMHCQNYPVRRVKVLRVKIKALF